MRENFAASRKRCPIFTAVASRWRALDTLTSICVLFRGKPGGRILGNLRRVYECTDRIMPQAQENGSYRKQDVLEAHDWMLPDAADSSESIVALLDSFCAHRTTAIADEI